MRKRTPLEEEAFRLKIDIPIGEVIGFTEFTEEEKKKNQETLLKLIEHYENEKKSNPDVI